MSIHATPSIHACTSTHECTHATPPKNPIQCRPVGMHVGLGGGGIYKKTGDQYK